MAVDWGRVDRGSKPFFFEKKNQKTFAPLRAVVALPLAKNDQSFFASFCSQKEVLASFP
jgi:hypothetical protein